MHQVRKRLTYANVMSSVAVFLVLGGAAVAATQLPKNSVGTKQLKNSAVTTAKIKKSAVNGNKIADGSITGADINTGKTVFSHVIAKMRGNSSLGVTETFQVYPLNPSTYTQAAEEDDTYLGALDITIPSTCTGTRRVVAYVTADAAEPTKEETEENIVALGTARDTASGTVNRRIELGPFVFLGTRFEPGTSKSHTLALVVNGKCEGGGSGITATAGAIDVIGTK